MSKRMPILLGLILVFISAWLLITQNKFVNNYIVSLDNIGYDLQLRTHMLTGKKNVLSPIAIIDIDEKSLKAEGHWPWPRDKLASLVNQLKAYGVAVIAFDMLFPEKENNIAETVSKELQKRNLINVATVDLLNKNKAYFDDDITLAKSLSENQTVLGVGFEPVDQTTNDIPPPLLVLSPQDKNELGLNSANGYVASVPVLQKAAKYAGFINAYPDSDGIIRRSPLLIEYHDGVYPALSLQAVMLFLGENVSLVTPQYDNGKQLEGIQLGSHIIPTDAKGQALIPFVGGSYTFPYYSASDVMQNHIPKDALSGKIVFLGTSAIGLGDLQPTAIQSPYPGVEIQASLANGMLQNNFSFMPAWTRGAELFLIIILGLISVFTFPYLGPRTLSLLIITLPPALFFINNLVWEQTGFVISLLVPVILIINLALLNIIYGYLFETRRREQLKEMFGQYVPKKHIDEMLKTPENFGLRGEDREMTVLFADIRNFTTISEGMTATELVAMLNTFLNPMTEIIFKHHGTIDKYVGDLIMAFWSAPLKDKHHARHAIESALDMQAKIIEFQKIAAQHQWPEIKIGIGINSGKMSVGDMGSRFRRNYTVLGDAVNLASRVEGLTKFYGVNTIVTENTMKKQSRFVFRKLDRVRVKGKKDGVSIYELICTNANLTLELTQELELYDEALNAYFQQQWDESYSLFTRLQKMYSDKKIYHVYLDRINEIKNRPLPADWDGVFVHVSK